MAKVLLDVAVVLLAAQALGRAFARFGQPTVIGQIVGGILLGPTLLGALPGDPTHWLFPASATSQLQTIGQLGLSVFMFTVGWDLDLATVGREARAATAISSLSMVVPFGFGLAIAVALYPAHRGTGSELAYWPFALFVGASLSITAFPVLARILAETGMSGSRIGATALTAAALDDAFGWCVLAVVLAIAHGGGTWEYLRVILETLAYGAAMVMVARPVLTGLATRGARSGTANGIALPLLLTGLLASSYATDAIGVHPVFGAFLFGAIMPRWRDDGTLARWRSGLDPIAIFLLPVYFVVSGLAVNIRSLSWSDLGYLAIVVLAASVGKFGGTFGAATTSGFGRRDAATLGVLMNTRGLIEIVLLTIGLQQHIIDVPLFSLLVLMALITTIATPPALRLLHAGEGAQPPARAEPPIAAARPL